MTNEFKAGDLVFELSASKGILLTTICRVKSCEYYLSTDHATYTGQGVNAQLPISRLFHATPENRQALVTLYGEDAVPKLPPSPHEVTRKLLKNQKYQLCKVSNHSTDWERNDNLKAIVYIGVSGEFFDSNGWDWFYGIPVDNNGNEITEIE